MATLRRPGFTRQRSQARDPLETATCFFRTVGFYHSQKARYSDGVLARVSFMNGAKAYLRAADTYPEDDELHACK